MPYSLSPDSGSGTKPTSPDIEGPFYKEGAPDRSRLVDSPTFVLRGKVTDTEGKPVAAVLDFWQADTEGFYDNEGFDLRGKQSTHGEYVLETIRPGHYPISDTEFRCSHLHVKVSGEGCKPLTTQLYFSDDKYDATDHWFDASRCVTMVDDANARFDFVLARS